MKKKKKQLDSIKRIEDVQELLRKNNYDEEAISEFCIMVKPFYDFYDYMLETHKMDYDMVEKIPENIPRIYFKNIWVR